MFHLLELLDLEEEGIVILCSAGKHHIMKQHHVPEDLNSSPVLLREPQISHFTCYIIVISL